MTRATNRLTALQIKSAPPGKMQDGGGLILVKTATGGQWVYRYSIAKERREMGGSRHRAGGRGGAVAAGVI